MADVKKRYPYQDIILQIMAENKMKSQTEFADSIGVNRDRVSNWINGRSDIDIDSLIAISEKYGLSIDYLLGRIKENIPSSDLRSVCEYTGLTAAAIENIRIFSKTLSPYLESKLLPSVIYAMENAQDIAEQIPFYFESEEKYANAIPRLMQAYQFSRYDISEAVLSVFDNINSKAANLVAGAKMVYDYHGIPVLRKHKK